MPNVIGIVLSAGVAVFGYVGFDRDRTAWVVVVAGLDLDFLPCS